MKFGIARGQPTFVLQISHCQ